MFVRVEHSPGVVDGDAAEAQTGWQQDHRRGEPVPSQMRALPDPSGPLIRKALRDGRPFIAQHTSCRLCAHTMATGSPSPGDTSHGMSSRSAALAASPHRIPSLLGRTSANAQRMGRSSRGAGRDGGSAKHGHPRPLRSAAMRRATLVGKASRALIGHAPSCSMSSQRCAGGGGDHAVVTLVGCA